MKFQDDISNMNTYVRTYIRTSRNQYVPYFFKVGGIMSCVLIGQNTIFIMFLVFFKFTKVRFAYCHSLASVLFGKQYRVRPEY